MRLQNTPHFLEELHAADDAAVIHVPLVTNGAERLDLVHQTVDAAAELQWTQWVTLLHSATGVNHNTVVVKKHCFLSVAPLCPITHRWEHLCCCVHEVRATYLVKSITKIDL